MPLRAKLAPQLQFSALAAGAVTGCEHDRRHAAGAVRRKIQIRRHPEARQALVGDLLHPEAVARDGAEGLDLEVGRSLGNAADRREQLARTSARRRSAAARVVIAATACRRASSRGVARLFRYAISCCRASAIAGWPPAADRTRRSPGGLATNGSCGHEGQGAQLEPGLVPGPRARRAPAGVTQARTARTPASRPRRGRRWASARRSIDRRRRRRACPSPGCRRSASGRSDRV